MACVCGYLTWSHAGYFLVNGVFDIDARCLMRDCSGVTSSCLSDDVMKTVEDNGGIARGSNLAIFDGSVRGRYIYAHYAFSGLWESTEETGCVVHSDSWGLGNSCESGFKTMEYDSCMYQLRLSQYVRLGETRGGHLIRAVGT